MKGRARNRGVDSRGAGRGKGRCTMAKRVEAMRQRGMRLKQLKRTGGKVAVVANKGGSSRRSLMGTGASA